MSAFPSCFLKEFEQLVPGDCKHCVDENNWWITMQPGLVSHTLPFKSLSEEWFLITRSCYYSPREREGINCLNNNEGAFGTKLLPKHLANAGGGSENGRRSSACRRDITLLKVTHLWRRIKYDGPNQHLAKFLPLLFGLTLAHQEGSKAIGFHETHTGESSGAARQPGSRPAGGHRGQQPPRRGGHASGRGKVGARRSTEGARSQGRERVLSLQGVGQDWGKPPPRH